MSKTESEKIMDNIINSVSNQELNNVCPPQSNKNNNKDKDDIRYQRETEYYNLTKSFVGVYENTNKNKEIFKNVFFYSIISLYILIIIASIILVLFETFKNSNNLKILLPSVISGMSAIITSTIILPKIIAKYLFNPTETKDMTQIIKNMQEYDAHLDDNRSKRFRYRKNKKIK